MTNGQEAAVAVPETAARDADELSADLASFDYVWETIRDRTWDSEFDLEAWEAVRDEYRPQIESSDSIQATRRLLRAMINSLSKSHYAIIPSDLYDKIKSAKEEKAEEKEEEDGSDEEEEEDTDLGELGMTLRIVDGIALVVRVEAGSAADDAGIKSGRVKPTLEHCCFSIAVVLWKETPRLVMPTSRGFLDHANGFQSPTWQDSRRSQLPPPLATL